MFIVGFARACCALFTVLSLTGARAALLTTADSAMTPQGTLVAYSTPANVKQVRDQAALISMALNDSALKSSHDQGSIQAVTIHVDAHNLIARRVQPTLLVVLVGSLPPYGQRDFRIVVEREGDERYPSSAGNEDGDLDDVLLKAKDMQRSKLDALCDFIIVEMVGSDSTADGATDPSD